MHDAFKMPFEIIRQKNYLRESKMYSLNNLEMVLPLNDPFIHSFQYNYFDN